MKYLYFPGCTVLSKDPSFEISARKVFAYLGIEIFDEDDFSCCSPTTMESLNKVTSLALTARNLCLAEARGMDIITLCSGCMKALKKANDKLKENKELRDQVNEVLSHIGMEFKGTIEVKHFLHVLYNEIGIKKIKEKVVNPLNDLVFGTFYGCHVIRPHALTQFDDPEYPTSLDRIVEALGAKTVDYEGKKVCCGGYLKGVNDKVATELPRAKLKSLAKLGVDGLIFVCPFCYFQFDLGQFDIQRLYNEKYDIAPLHLTEVLGIAFGLDHKELGLLTHRIKPTNLLKKLALA